MNDAMQRLVEAVEYALANHAIVCRVDEDYKCIGENCPEQSLRSALAAVKQAAATQVGDVSHETRTLSKRGPVLTAKGFRPGVAKRLTVLEGHEHCDVCEEPLQSVLYFEEARASNADAQSPSYIRICDACVARAHGERLPDVRLDIALVEHGYQASIYEETDGTLREEAGGCRDFGRDHSIESLRADLISHLERAISAWFRGK